MGGKRHESSGWLAIISRNRSAAGLLLGLLFASAAQAEEPPITLRGEIVDRESGEPVAARLYIRRTKQNFYEYKQDDDWYYAQSADKAGNAVPYKKHREGSKSYEMNTSLTAHPFTAALPPGEYTLTVERGKEYLPQTRDVKIGEQPLTVKFELDRWINLAARNWYSGDTHVHLPLADLPTAMLANDLNVAFPLTSWVTRAFETPNSDKTRESVKVVPQLVQVDKTHVYWSLNTEWEIFTVKENRHALGAVFALGQTAPIELGVPPVGPVRDEVRRQEALLELDKHNWPWSMMLVPVMKVDLYELSNNHIWRAPFHFGDFNPKFTPPELQSKLVGGKFTEEGWIEFGFWNYYALLNCGLRMQPTAGTATGVHPVPLGFGRVYVETPGGFSYQAWKTNLKAGRSFVTTGPMLFVKANDKPAGTVFQLAPETATANCHLTGTAESALPLKSIEIIVNGQVAQTINPGNLHQKSGGYLSPIDAKLELPTSSWVAVRIFEQQGDGRIRFAHSSPFHFDLPGKPLVPRRFEAAFLQGRVEDDLERHKDVLPEAALEEYRQAAEFYRKLYDRAK